MLETLDHLATRIGRLVAQARDLHAERDALRGRVRDADKTAQALHVRCEQAEADLRTARAQLAACEQALSDEQNRARALEADLRAQLDHQARELQVLADRHEARQCALQRLRQVSADTRERIDAVLERLPGAAPAESTDTLPGETTGGPQS